MAIVAHASRLLVAAACGALAYLPTANALGTRASVHRRCLSSRTVVRQDVRPVLSASENEEAGDPPEQLDLGCQQVPLQSVDKGPYQLTSGDEMPERFDLQLRALNGDFSPGADVGDTERDDGLLLEALVGFPTLVPVKVVAKPKDADEQAALLEEIKATCERCGLSPPQELLVTPRLGGKATSIGFNVFAPSAGTLNTFRKTMRADPRVRMLF